MSEHVSAQDAEHSSGKSETEETMHKTKHILLHELWRSVPLFLCGVFLIYIATADETLFIFIAEDLADGLASRVVVATATVLAATIPMFFAVGAIKQSALIGRETIYYYEKMLTSVAFWVVAGLVPTSIAIVMYIQYAVYYNPRIISLPGIVTALGCILCALYFFYHTYDLRKVE